MGRGGGVTKQALWLVLRSDTACRRHNTSLPTIQQLQMVHVDLSSVSLCLAPSLCLSPRRQVYHLVARPLEGISAAKASMSSSTELDLAGPLALLLVDTGRLGRPSPADESSCDLWRSSA